MTRWGSPLNLMTWPLRTSLAAGMTESGRRLLVWKGDRNTERLSAVSTAVSRFVQSRPARAEIMQGAGATAAPNHLQACHFQVVSDTARHTHEAAHPLARGLHQGQCPAHRRRRAY